MEFVDGSFDDWVVGENELEGDLTDWARNQLRYAGQALDVEWLDDSASEHVRVHVLRLDPGLTADSSDSQGRESAPQS